MPIKFIHIIVSLVLIVVVLIQHGQGDMGAIFGGSSQTVFGGSGAGNFLTRFTTVLAVVFMCTSLLLAMKIGQGKSTSSVMTDMEPVKNEEAIPAPNTESKKAVPLAPAGSPKTVTKAITVPVKAKKSSTPPIPGQAPVSSMPPTPGG